MLSAVVCMHVFYLYGRYSEIWEKAVPKSRGNVVSCFNAEYANGPRELTMPVSNLGKLTAVITYLFFIVVRVVYSFHEHFPVINFTG